jgi:hypothetical protein
LPGSRRRPDAAITAGQPSAAASILNFGGYIGATISPGVTSVIVDTTGSFALGLAIAAAVAIIGALSYLFGVTTTIDAAELSGEAPALRSADLPKGNSAMADRFPPTCRQTVQRAT